MSTKPIVIAIPHAAIFVPAALRRQMLIHEKVIRKHADLYTDEIFDVPDAQIVKAKTSRLVADPNRAPDDIAMEYHLHEDGVVVSITEDGMPIYRRGPRPAGIEKRLMQYHHTFHEQLDTATQNAEFLIDAHSLLSVGPATKADAGKPRADISLGNREYSSCTRAQTEFFYDFFKSRGYSVAINKPYPGGYVLGYHCSRRKLPGIQIEFNRKLYMNERTLARHSVQIKKLNKTMRVLVAELQDFLGQ